MSRRACSRPTTPYLSLQIFYDVAPVLVLVTTLVTFGLLSQRNEVVAAKALGFSLFRLAIPALVAAGRDRPAQRCPRELGAAGFQREGSRVEGPDPRQFGTGQELPGHGSSVALCPGTAPAPATSTTIATTMPTARPCSACKCSGSTANTRLIGRLYAAAARFVPGSEAETGGLAPGGRLGARVRRPDDHQQQPIRRTPNRSICRRGRSSSTRRSSTPIR